MARVQAADYDQKREAITRHAARLFARRGFGGASIADLASACGFSKSLVYHYYAAKEDILYDVMRDHIDTLVAVTERVAADENDATTKFRRLAQSLLDRYVGASDSQKVLLYELAHLTAVQQADIVAKQRQIVDFTQYLLAEIAPHPIPHAELRVIVMLFYGMLNWTDNWYRREGSVSREKVADTAVNVILGHLADDQRN